MNCSTDLPGCCVLMNFARSKIVFLPTWKIFSNLALMAACIATSASIGAIDCRVSSASGPKQYRNVLICFDCAATERLEAE